MTPEQQAALDAARARLAAQAAAQQRLAQPTAAPTTGFAQRQPAQAGAPIYESLRVDPLGIAPPPQATAPAGAVHQPEPPRIQAERITSPQERLQAAGTLAQGATFGFADELGGLGGGIRALFDPNMSFREGYDQTRGDMLADVEAQRERDPNAALGMEIAGGLLSGVGAGRAGLTLLHSARPTVASVAGRTALESTAYGALYGIGTGDTLVERLTGGAEQGAFGFGVGTLFGIPLGWAVGRAARSASRAAGTPLDEINAARIPNDHPLRQEVNQLYGQMRQAGITLDPASVNSLRTRLLAVSQGTRTPLTQETGGLWAVVDRIDQNPVTNQAFGIDDLDVLRQQIRNAPETPQQGEIARQMVSEIDRYIASLTPAQVATQAQNVPVEQVTQWLTQARAANTRLQKANRITEAFYDATTTGGGDRLNNIRNQFRNLAHDNEFMQGLTQAERNTINLVAQGDSIDQFLRNVERLGPTSTLSLLDWRTLLAGGLGFWAAGPIGAGAAAMTTAAAGTVAGGVRNSLRNAAITLAERQFRGVPSTGPVAPFGVPGAAALGAATPAEGALMEQWRARRVAGPPSLPFGVPTFQ